MKCFVALLALLLLSCSSQRPTPAPEAARAAAPSARISWPSHLPTYDHVVIVVEENKGYDQIIGSSAAPYINGTLKTEGANLTQMYGEEHPSQGNYFWLFSGANQNVEFHDHVHSTPITASNLGQQLIGVNRSFNGYAEDLPHIGAVDIERALYARRHVPWISFSNVPNGTTVATSSNLRLEDFPTDFRDLPTVAFVIPNLLHDMHNGSPPGSIEAGDTWLRTHVNAYYQWAKQHNSLLILTFDEDEHGHIPGALTDPIDREPTKRNRIVTILAGARVKRGDYPEGKGVTHVNLLRTLEAMYGLPRSGAQQRFATKAGIADDFVLTDLFEATP